MNPALCCSNNKHLVAADIHRVHALLGIDRCDGCLLPQIPVLHGLVPATSHQHGRAVRIERLHALDRRIVRRDLCWLGEVTAEIEHARGLVCAYSEHFCAVLVSSLAEILRTTY